MSMKVTRRQAVGVVGAAVAFAPTAMAFASQERRNSSEVPAAAGGALDGAALLEPVRAGTQLGSWQVDRIGVLAAGAIAVELIDAAGVRFHLDVCAHDGGFGAAEPPARTEFCDIFVANEGTGADSTVEDHGLAAMALAEVIRTNERRVDLRGLETLRSRLRHHAGEIKRGCG